ncbi:MAG: MFS transporter [Candidatus Marinimicrobia bacterium]|nr:MFS transporter [Candidatus Neomarinimicrobiota bacterium]
MTSPGQTYSVSIFIEHFISDLEISRSLVSTLYTVATLIGSFALPLVGRQIDTLGSRAVMVIISLLFGVACIYMGFITNAVMLVIGFIAIRMLGQGSLVLVSNNVINQWWVKRRGLMVGISGLLMALLGLGGFPNLINWLIPQFGWRWTYGILGLILLVFMAPLAWLFIRNKPEDFGVKPDGAAETDNSKLEPGGIKIEDTPEVNWTLQEAYKTAAFWILVASISMIAMMHTGLFFHMVSIFQDNGLDPAVAASVYVPIALTTAVVNLSSGFLVDRFPVRILLAIMLLFQAVSLFMAQYLSTIVLAFSYGILLGATGGLMRTINSVAFAKYYGRLHLGAITGVTSTILIAGSALGPMPLGIARDMLGSYNLTLTIFSTLPLVLAVVSLFMSKPEKETAG